ncbi:hypothetical protein P153DRAFT_364047 [Dothidotthia symphoricarpi CBS 119687]|uniref:EthD domain-containing protein n=1 Tax=Dothidotthia symphoricarpi CBS 119687 TaxID=1392245 RepID=A0A6A6ANK0_9PLEO|nr:uncharacterized protein P153DRAFT_364047 [Dothidotthia symphoricarpi CBS 119687]KAF2132773.1 hypothetical protein P153DRAFT_364047 [Dothidotthia symphoricarpi CBS 119687]
MASHSAQVTVLYPQKEGSTFDIDYYHNNHLPLCEKHWKPFGLKSWNVTQFDSAAPYSFCLVADFETLEGFQKASADPSIAEIMADVPKYSSEQPVLLAGAVVSRG